MLNHY
jgi:glycosyltransferase involved in cell wall biosynthesis